MEELQFLLNGNLGNNYFYMDSSELSKELQKEILRREKELCRHLLEDWSNEIPEQLIHGEREFGGEFKVRGNWFHAVVLTVDECLAEKIINDEKLKEDIGGYILKRKTENKGKFGRNERTTKEEIDEADSLLRRIIEHLDLQLK